MRRLFGVIPDADTELLELLLGLLATLWGLGLLNPWSHTFVSAPGFSAMALLAPEWAWGVAVAVLGLLQLGGLRGRHPQARRVGALGGLFVWAFVGVMIFRGNWAGLGWIIWGVVATGCAIVYLRLPDPGRAGLEEPWWT